MDAPTGELLPRRSYPNVGAQFIAPSKGSINRAPTDQSIHVSAEVILKEEITGGPPIFTAAVVRRHSLKRDYWQNLK